jgi:hypothetical protein
MANRSNRTGNIPATRAAEARANDSSSPAIEVHGSEDADLNGSGPLPSWAPGGRLPPPPSPPKPTPAPPSSDVIVGSDLALASESAPIAGPRFTPEDALDEQIGDLESWARTIVRRHRIEAARFWLIRGLSFCAAATAVALVLKGFALVPVALVAVSALGLAIEMGWPGAAANETHRRAVYDLRDLQSLVKLRWQKVRLSHPSPTSRKRVAYAVELLETIFAKRRDVGAYLGDSEANPGIRRPD